MIRRTMNERPLAMKLAFYVAAAALVVLAIGPALWLLNVALQPRGIGIDQITPPGDYTLRNFSGTLAAAGLWRPLLNSLFVTTCQAFLNVLLAALAAYPLARMEFRGRTTGFMVVLATLMVPEQVIVVPLYVTIIDMSLADTLLATFLPFSVTAFGIYLCRQAFISIPDELEEAARIDGAGAGRIWWNVMLPLASPTLATLATFSIIAAWSNLLWPLIVLQSAEKYTLPVAINQLMSVFAAEVRYAYAASVMALIPMVLMYIVMQRWLSRGLLAGAVKG